MRVRESKIKIKIPSVLNHKTQSTSRLPKIRRLGPTEDRGKRPARSGQPTEWRRVDLWTHSALSSVARSSNGCFSSAVNLRQYPVHFSENSATLNFFSTSSALPPSAVISATASTRFLHTKMKNLIDSRNMNVTRHHKDDPKRRHDVDAAVPARRPAQDEMAAYERSRRQSTRWRDAVAAYCGAGRYDTGTSDTTRCDVLWCT